MKILLILSMLMTILTACQPAIATPLSTSTPPGQMETMVAATQYADQTSTAAAERAEKAILTAAIPSPTATLEASPTPNAFYFSLPASACWGNSEIAVRADQTVVIRASVRSIHGMAGQAATATRTGSQVFAAQFSVRCRVWVMEP